jgi:hypothetical protein
VLATSNANSVITRADTNEVIPLCAGTAAALYVTNAHQETTLYGAYCLVGSTLSVYDWNADSVRTVSSAVTGGVAVHGGVVTWNEAGAVRGVLVGEGAPVMTLCDGTTQLNAPTWSTDNHVLAYQCGPSNTPDAPALAVDFRLRVQKTVLAPPSGTWISPYFFVSAGGRLVAISYSTNAPPTADCSGYSCTAAYDMGSASSVPIPGVPMALQESAVFALGRLMLLSSGPPSIVPVPAGLDGLFGSSPDRRYVFGWTNGTGAGPLVDLVTGTSVSLRLFQSNAVPVGDSGWFLLGDGLLNLNEGSFEPTPSWSPLCATYGLQMVADSFSYLDSTQTLHRVSRMGDSVLAKNARYVAGACAGPLVIETDFDGRAGTLANYDQNTGVISTILPNAAPLLAERGSLAFGFGNPDHDNGDLALVDLQTARATPLGARAALEPKIFLVSRSRVAFDSVIPGAQVNQLWVAMLDGSGAKPLGPASQAWFSPDESRVLFYDGSKAALWAEDSSGRAAYVDDHVTVFSTDPTGTHLLYSKATGTWIATVH